MYVLAARHDCSAGCYDQPRPVAVRLHLHTARRLMLGHGESPTRLGVCRVWRQPLLSVYVALNLAAGMYQSAPSGRLVAGPVT